MRLPAIYVVQSVLLVFVNNSGAITCGSAMTTILWLGASAHAVEAVSSIASSSIAALLIKNLVVLISLVFI